MDISGIAGKMIRINDVDIKISNLRNEKITIDKTSALLSLKPNVKNDNELKLYDGKYKKLIQEQAVAKLLMKFHNFDISMVLPDPHLI